MKKNLNIMMGGEPRKHLRDYDIVADFTDDYKPLGANEGRTGYLHVCKDGEERREPTFEIFEYEGNIAPISLCR